MSRLESENRQLHGEVAELKENIGQMRTDMQNMKDSHTAERLRASEQHQREIGNLRRIVDKANEWFPMLAEFLKIERLCRSVGLSEKYTDELLQGKVLVVTGKTAVGGIQRRSFAAEKVRLQVGRTEKEGKTILDLLVDRVPIAGWGSKGQWERLEQDVYLFLKRKQEQGSQGVTMSACSLFCISFHDLFRQGCFLIRYFRHEYVFPCHARQERQDRMNFS